MTIKVKDLLIILGITAGLLFALEKASGYILDKRLSSKPEISFRRQFLNFDLSFMNDCCSYRQADPLLGWAMTPEQLLSKGWQLKNNCIKLEHITPGSTDTLLILITGGSTSDLGLDPNSWPIRLSERLKARQASFILYVGAVGAYGSSQEVLKLIRDGLPLKPDIHISYNGANEFQNPYYVSPFEHNFYKQALFQNQASPVLPNTIFLLREWLGLNKNTMVLKDYPVSNGVDQWEKNMEIMNALSIGNGYRFIGILQPVVGIGSILDSKKDPAIQPLLQEYQQFYPGALQIIHSKPYLHDFTHIFDGIGDKAFRDDCHLYPEYQDRVAQHIEAILVQTH